MKTVSIGFVRDDGDLQLLATLNNNDCLMCQDQFDDWVEMNVAFFNENPASDLDEEVVALERQDAPDYVSIEATA